VSELQTTPKAQAKAIYSMTGFASAQSATEDGLAFTLTFKSVNHRFLDLNLRLPGDCDAVEVALRRLMKEKVRRGHVDVTLHVDRRSREAVQTIQLNRELLAAHLNAFHEAAKLHHFNVEPDLNELLRMPGVLSTEAPPPPADTSRASALEVAVMAIAPSPAPTTKCSGLMPASTVLLPEAALPGSAKRSPPLVSNQDLASAVFKAPDTKLIEGEPMKPATNLLAGRS